MKAHRTAGLTALAFFALSASSAEPSREGCVNFQFDLSKELALFEQQAQPVAAAAALDAGTPTIDANKPYAARLLPQKDVRFSPPPGRESKSDGSYAGVLRVAPTSATTLRVTLNEGAWVDLIAGGKAIESVRHTGSRNCSLLRKSVEFQVEPKAALVLQISGSTREAVSVGVTTH